MQAARESTVGDRSIDNDIATRVEQALADYLAIRHAGLAEMAPSFAPAIDALSEFVLGGGKRLRPTFAWWGWRACGGSDRGEQAEAVLRAASALELIQASALIHDDLMDASDVRRGKPTVHVSFAQRHRADGWLGEADRFGMSAAILIGDLALAWADDMFVSAGLEAHRHAEALEPWRGMRAEMLAGQFLDVRIQAVGDESADAALSVARMKTAAYTVERPLHMGAALAGADERLVGALRAFGADIGVAFQLRDDLLGVYGDPELTGKPAGDDLREGKRTVLVAAGLARAEEAGRTTDAALIRGALGDDNLDVATIERVREVLIDLGAVNEIEYRIDKLTTSALDALGSVEFADQATERLAGLAVAATRRSH